MYNNKQRRALEKQVGLSKLFKKLNDRQKAEVRLRRMKAGKEIHLQNIQAIEQKKQEREAEWYQQRIEFWQKYGLSIEEATLKADEDFARKTARAEKLAKKKNE